MTTDTTKSEDWLPLLLWGLDILINPTPSKILESFESWDYRNRLRPQLKQLERAKLLARRGRGRDAVRQLTPQGRLVACGGVDPVERWQRGWDGRWRLFLFDLSADHKSLRWRLWRWLRGKRFGYLQNSVWIRPDPVDQAHLPLRQLKLTPESFTVVEGRPAAPDSDADIVRSAWDFATINQHYETALDLAGRGIELASDATAKPVQLRQWLAAEREAWLAAIYADPLLPEALLPPGYLGREAWEQRRAAYKALAQRIRA